MLKQETSLAEASAKGVARSKAPGPPLPGGGPFFAGRTPPWRAIPTKPNDDGSVMPRCRRPRREPGHHYRRFVS
jgi:hypothetical protein